MIRLAKQQPLTLLFVWIAMAAVFVITLAPQICHALCATVKIEIQQELTLERQAFDAHMRINNGLSTMSIEDVAVTVSFSDEEGNPVLATDDPDDTTAQFFIRIDTMDNIENVEGTGSVAPETSADIHWLIIPAPGASNGLESGTLYFVGATLNYTAGGVAETIEVTPDYIFVKPMPQLVLDYFIPTDVYGDDAWTSNTIELPVPFSLGLRINNKGNGWARDLKVESAQPRIVENELGALIGFQIIGTSVNGQSAVNSLLTDFGDIAPDKAGMASWLMTCTHSGTFTDFTAEFSHADELGGKLTSLIDTDDVRTHFLVHTVIVDAQGRDAIEDFLANDNEVYRVFESDNVETEVVNQSANASLTAQTSGYRLAIPASDGFIFARVADPTNGSMLVGEAMRSDGKRIKSANVWLSKTREGSGPWQYYLNLFDYNTPGVYTINFQNIADIPQAPVITYVPNYTRIEGEQLSFIVASTDPNGTIPALTAERLPIGATFQDQGDGSAIFNWIPTPGQAGRYSIRFVASDGELESSRQATIRIFSQEDTDGDGMLDSWEMEHFGTLDRDGSADYDNDGISDLEEFLNGSDPEVSQSAPSVPEIFYPEIGQHIDQLSLDLEVANSIDPEGDACTYTFEIYGDESCKNLLAAQADVPSQSTTTAWSVPVTLTDNTKYYWRVRASDATASTDWAYGQFFTNTSNDPPTAPHISSPADGLDVDTLTPVLEIMNATDPDDESLDYTFEIYADSSMATLVTAITGIPAGDHFRTSWTVDTPLQEAASYYWRAIAVDPQGASTASPLSLFQVNTANSAPPAPAIVFPLDGTEALDDYIELTISNVEDPDGDTVTYLFEIDSAPDFSSSDKITSEHVSPMDPNTIWFLQELTDNTRYYWRVKSSDGLSESMWTYGSFFVNTLNESPDQPAIKHPAIDAWVNTRTPLLAVHPVSDPDLDALFYRFEIYTDADLTQPAGYTESDQPVWSAVSPLAASTWHYWRVQAVDEHGLPGQWSETGRFFVKENGINLPPQINFITPGTDEHTNAQQITIRWTDTDPDSNAVIALYYDTDNSGADGTSIIENIEEDPDGTDDYYTWDVSTLEGTYYLYAVISDAQNSETVYSTAALTLDHTAPIITASPAGGAFADTVQVQLDTNESADIYFTLDGTEPTINAEVYTEPLNISQDTTIRFMGVDTAGNQCAPVSETYTFAATEITLSVSTDKDRILNGLRVYAFTAAGSYTGYNATTDSAGEAVFDPALFTDGTYKFRIDYLGSRFWSQEVNLPDTRSISVVIPEESTVVTVETAAGPASGVRVYLFSATGAYLGQYLITDANGQVTFDLPVGMDVMFRADLYNAQYWSNVTTISAGAVNVAPVDAGGGLLQAEVSKAVDQPLAGLRVYLFNTNGAYLGHNATTDADGRVGFDVPDGNYKLRVDYLGYQFWSDDTQVVTDTVATVTIPHQQVQASVQGRFEGIDEPIENINVYLFTTSGSYMGIKGTTDAQGHVIFEVPEKGYEVRADYMGQQYWSEAFTWQDPVITIPMADARVTVTGAGYPLENVPVYLFTTNNSYLGLNRATGADGQCTFHLPEGTYRFRADYQGSQFWSNDAPLTADQLNDISISTGGGSFAFTVLSGAAQPLEGAECYVFNDQNVYLGLHGPTDKNGQVAFDLSDGIYLLRVDHLGYQFWSDAVQLPDQTSAEVTIAHTPVNVTVQTAAGPAPNIPVYLFTEAGAYQGIRLVSDDQGQVRFNLPAGVSYMFRADLSGNQYWSDPIQVPTSASAAITINAGGGQLQLTVQDGTATPMSGLSVYLFDGGNTYLGLQQPTDASGTVVFDVPQGDYRLRIDYLGYSYWPDPIEVYGDNQITFTINHHAVTIDVLGRFQTVDTPFEAVRVYLFTPTGSYLGQVLETDAGGQVAFTLPEQNYIVRADVIGRQYWSGTFNSQDQTIIIPMADLQVAVTGAGLPQADISAYLFSEAGAYLNHKAATDENGQAIFRVPEGTYLVRIDYQGNQYWSTPQPVAADQVNPVVISVGGGTFSLNIQQDTATPMTGIRTFVFNGSGSYMGYYGATDDQGLVYFDLADGTVQFRADYLGYQYWSQPVTIPDTLAAAIEIPHQDITIRLTVNYLGSDEPLSGQQMYLFTPSGSYLGIHKTSDENGQVVFSVPDQPYMIRADYLSEHYWSQPFQSQDVNIEIDQGAVDLHVVRNSADLAGARVYLFTPAGSYLGRYMVTDSSGWTAFILPEGTYRFRVDIDGSQSWTADTTVSADETQSLEIEIQ